MIVCEEKKLLYLAPPKTGSASMVKLLIGPKFNGHYYDAKFNHHNTVWDEKFRDWYIFITARHPYTKAVSFWRYACFLAYNKKNVDSPKAWVNVFKRGLPNLTGFLLFPRLQYAFTTVWRTSWHLEEMQRPVDKIVYQEHFAEDIKEVPALHGYDVPVENTGPLSRYPWHSFYTEEAIKHIQELWGADFEAFGYNPNFNECVDGNFFTPKNPHYREPFTDPT